VKRIRNWLVGTVLAGGLALGAGALVPSKAAGECGPQMHDWANLCRITCCKMCNCCVDDPCQPGGGG